jgi:hypothetical protein
VTPANLKHKYKRLSNIAEKDRPDGCIHRSYPWSPAGMGGRGKGLLRGRRSNGLLAFVARIAFPRHVRAQTQSAVPDKRQGAYQTYEQGREASISCACHWAVNKAASAGFGRLWGECYTITPCGIFVPAHSAIHTPEDLADIGVHVGY